LGFGGRTLSTTPPVIENSTPWEFMITTYHPRTSSELHPPILPCPLSCSSAFAPWFLGVSQLTFSGSRLAFSLPRLGHGRLATPSCPGYRRLVLQFAVGANLSTAYSRFVYFLHARPLAVPSQTCTGLPILSAVIGFCHSPLLSGLVPLLGYTSHPLTWLASYSPFTVPVASPWSQPSFTLSRRIALFPWPMSTVWVLE